MDIRLYQGDCLDVMRSIPDGSVDMVLCDLPYGTTACKWDSVIPLEPLWEQYNRLLKHQGSVVLFGSEPFSSSLRMSNISAYKYDWIWKKNRPTGFQHAQNMPLKDYETISVFSKASMGHDNLLKEKRMWYNPQGITHCGKEWKRTASKFWSIVGKRKSHKNFGIQEFTGFPTMVLEYDKDETNYHPTQKPVALLSYLIKTYTMGGGATVLDNCMGSGSTGVACIETARSFIGIEKDAQYFAVAQKRIANRREQGVQQDLFGD